MSASAAFVKAGQKGGVPQGRYGHTLTLIGGDAAVLAGGRDASPMSDIRCLKLSDLSWITPSVHGRHPPPRFSHASCALPRGVLYFGGRDKAGAESAELSLLDTSAPLQGPMHWCHVVSKGEAPSPRSGHSITSLEGEGGFVVFGGRGAGGRLLNDVHFGRMGGAAAAWDSPCKECDDVCEAATVMWSGCGDGEQEGGMAPMPREGHTAVMVRSRLIVAGGQGEGGAVQDCCVFDTLTMQWSTAPFTLASPLCSHSCLRLPPIQANPYFAQGGILIVGGRLGVEGGNDDKASCARATTLSLLHVVDDDQDGDDNGEQGGVTVCECDGMPALEGLCSLLDVKRSRALVWGGLGEKGSVRDMYALDLNVFDPRPMPVVQRVVPDKGPCNATTAVKLYGTGLEGDQVDVYLSQGGGKGEEVHVDGMADGQGGVIFIAPASSTPETGDVVLISVSVDGGRRSEVGKPQFAYVPSRPPPSPEGLGGGSTAGKAGGELNGGRVKLPLIEALVPGEGSSAGGERVVVRGSGLRGLRAQVKMEGGEGRIARAEGVCDGAGCVLFQAPAWPCGEDVSVSLSIDDGHWSTTRACFTFKAPDQVSGQKGEQSGEEAGAADSTPPRVSPSPPGSPPQVPLVQPSDTAIPREVKGEKDEEGGEQEGGASKETEDSFVRIGSGRTPFAYRIRREVKTARAATPKK